MFIFLISGKAQHGKDTVGDIIENILNKNSKKTTRLAFGDYVKEIAKKTGWNGVKDEYGRELLINIGTNGRDLDEDMWVNRAIDDASLLFHHLDYIIVTDCRYENEIERFKEYLEFDSDLFTTIRVSRPDFDNKLTEKQRNDESEIGLDNYTFDWDIDNNSDLESLENKVEKILKELEFNI